MSERGESSRILTQRRQLRRSTTLRFSKAAWYRFSQNERGNLVARVGGSPDRREALLIERIIKVQWSLRRCYARAEAASGREQDAAFDRAVKFEGVLKLLDRDLAAATRARESAVETASQKPLDYHQLVAQRERSAP